MARDAVNDQPTLSRFELWAEVLGPVIRLHDREADAELIEGLWQSDFADLLAAVLGGTEGAGAAEGFARVLAGFPRPVPDELLDELAADFADAYLNHGFRAAPTGSVWMTEDHLERQEPMFAVRDWYAHYGLTVPNWRVRPDDHIMHELQFIAHLLSIGTADALFDAAVFLDDHVLPWVPDFCLRVASRARHPFHAGACLITRALLTTLRDDLTLATDRPAQVQDHAWKAQEDRARRQLEAEAERPYVPGLSESW